MVSYKPRVEQIAKVGRLRMCKVPVQIRGNKNSSAPYECLDLCFFDLPKAFPPWLNELSMPPSQ